MMVSDVQMARAKWIAIMYGDFFEKPRESRMGGVDGKEKARAKPKKSGEAKLGKDRRKAKGVCFEAGDEWTEEDEVEEEEGGRDVMSRVKGDLFDEEEEEEEQSRSLPSTPNTSCSSPRSLNSRNPPTRARQADRGART